MKFTKILSLAIAMISFAQVAHAEDCRRSAAEAIVLAATKIANYSEVIKSTLVKGTKGNSFTVRVGSGTYAEAVYVVKVSMIQTALENGAVDTNCVINSMVRH